MDSIRWDGLNDAFSNKHSGRGIGDVERIEINEAFAPVPMVVARELGFAEDVVTVDGGAVVHGHPIGATGAFPTTRPRPAC